MIVQKGEREFNFCIDIEKAIELEEKDGFNIFDGIESMLTAKGNPSLLGLNRICTAVLGHPLAELINAGFTLTDLMGEDGIIMSVFAEAGFISAPKGGDSSSDATDGQQASELA